jgi:hypothetical protein
MIQWMVYEVIVTLILSAAALSADRALRLRRATTRFRRKASSFVMLRRFRWRRSRTSRGRLPLREPMQSTPSCNAIG